MSDDTLLTVADAATRLELHRKTVLRFIREGRLPAHRIGKSYRIRREDLQAFAGLPAAAAAPAPQPTVTAIVDLPGVHPELARKWMTTVTAALHSRPGRPGQMRAEVIYDPTSALLKIVVIGVPDDTVPFLGMVRALIEQLRA